MHARRQRIKESWLSIKEKRIGSNVTRKNQLKTIRRMELKFHDRQYSFQKRVLTHFTIAFVALSFFSYLQATAYYRALEVDFTKLSSIEDGLIFYLDHFNETLLAIFAACVTYLTYTFILFIIPFNTLSRKNYKLLISASAMSEWVLTFSLLFSLLIFASNLPPPDYSQLKMLPPNSLEVDKRKARKAIIEKYQFVEVSKSGSNIKLCRFLAGRIGNSYVFLDFKNKPTIEPKLKVTLSICTPSVKQLMGLD